MNKPISKIKNALPKALYYGTSLTLGCVLGGMFLFSYHSENTDPSTTLSPEDITTLTPEDMTTLTAEEMMLIEAQSKAKAVLAGAAYAGAMSFVLAYLAKKTFLHIISSKNKDEERLLNDKDQLPLYSLGKQDTDNPVDSNHVNEQNLSRQSEPEETQLSENDREITLIESPDTTELIEDSNSIRHRRGSNNTTSLNKGKAVIYTISGTLCFSLGFYLTYYKDDDPNAVRLTALSTYAGLSCAAIGIIAIRVLGEFINDQKAKNSKIIIQQPSISFKNGDYEKLKSASLSSIRIKILKDDPNIDRDSLLLNL